MFFCFIVPDHYSAATEDQPADPFLITIEDSTLFEAAYPDVVALYQMEKLKIGREKKKSKLKTLHVWFYCVLS